MMPAWKEKDKPKQLLLSGHEQSSHLGTELAMLVMPSLEVLCISFVTVSFVQVCRDDWFVEVLQTNLTLVLHE